MTHYIIDRTTFKVYKCPVSKINEREFMITGGAYTGITTREIHSFKEAIASIIKTMNREKNQVLNNARNQILGIDEDIKRVTNLKESEAIKYVKTAAYEYVPTASYSYNFPTTPGDVAITSNGLSAGSIYWSFPYSNGG